jgi:hypothetical protein
MSGLQTWIQCTIIHKKYSLLQLINNNEIISKVVSKFYCRNLTLKECEDETHTPEMGSSKSFMTPESSEFDYKGQNTLHRGVLYIIGKL